MVLVPGNPNSDIVRQTSPFTIKMKVFHHLVTDLVEQKTISHQTKYEFKR